MKTQDESPKTKLTKYDVSEIPKVENSEENQNIDDPVDIDHSNLVSDHKPLENNEDNAEDHEEAEDQDKDKIEVSDDNQENFIKEEKHHVEAPDEVPKIESNQELKINIRQVDDNEIEENKVENEASKSVSKEQHHLNLIIDDNSLGSEKASVSNQSDNVQYPEHQNDKVQSSINDEKENEGSKEEHFSFKTPYLVRGVKQLEKSVRDLF